MPDLLDELRRYADAAEQAVPHRDLPAAPAESRRARSWVLAAAAAAAVVALAVWIGTPNHQPASVDTADEPPVEDVGWELERVGAVDIGTMDAPVWFGDRWWTVDHVDGRVLSSADGAVWETAARPLADGTVLGSGSLVANDARLLLVGVDDEGRVVAAATTDGSEWQRSVVGASGVPDADLAHVVPVAFDEGAGVAVRVPDGEALETAAASQRLEELVEGFLDSRSFSFHVDPQDRTLHIHDESGAEVFAGSPIELGLTEPELDRIVASLTAGDAADSHDWVLHLSDDGTAWNVADLPTEARDGPAMEAVGRALTAVRFDRRDTLTTVDGRSWVPLDLSAASIGNGHSAGGAFRVTARDALWLLPEPASTDPVLRADGLGEPFRPTAVNRATAVARSGSITALLVDATPPHPSEQEDLEARWGWANAEFTWSDGTFQFVGSHTAGGTFTDLRTGRSWAISYDDLVGTGPNTEVVDGDVRVLDPDTGEVVVVIDGGAFKEALAEQHPRWADVLAGAPMPDPTPAPARRLRVAILAPGAPPVHVDLPSLPPEAEVATLVPGPDGTFLITAVTRIDGDADAFTVTERTAYLVRPR